MGRGSELSWVSYRGQMSFPSVKTVPIFFDATKKDLWVVKEPQRLPMYRREAMNGHVLRIEIEPICFHWDTTDCPIEVVSLTD